VVNLRLHLILQHQDYSTYQCCTECVKVTVGYIKEERKKKVKNPSKNMQSG